VSSTVTLVVPPRAAGQRVDLFVSTVDDEEDVAFVPPGISRSLIQKLIATGELTVDGHVVRASHRLCGGETIVMTLSDPTPTQLVGEPMELDVLYEDDQLIAVAKPAGLVVHPGAGHDTGTLVHGLLAHCDDLGGIGGELRPGIVHRLDRETSGVIVVAKTSRAHLEIARQFAEREVGKAYVAFVLGEPSPKRAIIDTFYGRHPKHRTRFTSRLTTGKRAVTSYQVVAAAAGISELQIALGTGRTHQIRVHMADRGHPVLADREYGGRQLDRIKDGGLRELVAKLGRQALHAARLELNHPISGDRLILEAPLPVELENLHQALCTCAGLDG